MEDYDRNKPPAPGKPAAPAPDSSQLLADIKRGAEANVRAALKQGADPDTKDAKSGQSALTAAIDSGFPNMVEMLIEKGANVNERDHRNRSRLEHAIDKYSVARFVRTSLSDKYAATYAKKIADIVAAAPRLDPAVKTSTGRSLADYARDAGLSDIAALLSKNSPAQSSAGGNAVDIDAH